VRHLKRQHGLTIIELLIALTISALLATAAAPFMGDYITNSRLREAGNLLLGEALMAQSEAVKRNTRVRVSTSGNTVQVLDMAVPATPVVLRERTLPPIATLPTSTFDFGSEGRTTPFGTAASIDLSSSTVVCSADLRCPGLRVDAGGAVRLCANKLSCS